MDKGTGCTATADDALLDDDYLQRLVDHYVAAARLAYRCGFAFVDIKQCHRYLLSELLAAKTRPGRYGRQPGEPHPAGARHHPGRPRRGAGVDDRHAAERL